MRGRLASCQTESQEARATDLRCLHRWSVAQTPGRVASQVPHCVHQTVTWKRTLALFFACVALVVVGTWFVLRETGVAKSFVQRLLTGVLAAPFALDRADVDLGGGIVRLTDFKLTHPTDRTRSLLTARDIHVSMNTNPLGEVGRVNKVVLRGLRIDDLWVAGPNTLQLSDILKSHAGAAAGSPGTTAIPAVVVENASVGLRFSETAAPLLFEDVDLQLLPLEGNSSTMILTGSMITLRGTRVTVSGQVDAAKGQFRVLAQTGEIEVLPAMVEPFSREIGAELAAANLRGKTAAAQLWLEADGESALRGGFQVDLSELSFIATQFPREVRNAQAKVTGRLQDGGSVALQLDARDERGGLALQGNVRGLFEAQPEANLTLTLAGLRVDDELLRAVATQPEGARVLEALAPGADGQIDGVAQLTLGERVEVAVDANPRGMSGTFRGFRGKSGRAISFPYRVQDLHGGLRVRDHVIHLENLRGGDARGGEVQVDGSIPLDAAMLGGTIKIQGRKVTFSDDLRQALAELDPRAAQRYADFAPEGHADVDVRVDGLTPPSRSSFYVHIRPLEAAATYARFPYRIEQLRGQVQIDDAGVLLELEGQRGGQPVNVHGRFLNTSQDTADASLRSELWVRCDAVGIDADLRSALRTLTPSLDQLWPKLNPSGQFGCEVAVWQTEGAADFSYDLRLDLHDGRMLAQAMPVQLFGLQGPLFVHGDGAISRTDVHLLRGQIEQGRPGENLPPADVTLSGVVTTDATGTAIDLSTVARRVLLTDALADVLDDTGAMQRAAWNNLRPSGAVDVIARHSVAASGARPTHDLRIQLREVGVAAEWLPKPASKLTGEILLRDGVARAEELRGLIGAAPVLIRAGRLSPLPGAARIEATVSADEFPVDDDLARLFGDSPLREAYLRRQPRGRAKVTSLRLDCTMPEPGTLSTPAPFRLTASGQMVMRDCSLLLATEVHHIEGVLEVSECQVDATAGRITGTLGSVSCNVLGHAIHDLSAAFDATASAIEFRRLSLRLHGGRVEGDAPPGAAHLRYATAGEGDLAANLKWTGVRLSDLVGAGTPAPTGVSGNLNGRLTLDSMPGARLLDATGRGEVRIAGGRLGDVPVFRAIYSVLKRQPQFNSADVDFRVAKRRLEIDKLDLGSQLVKVRGKGHVTMEGYLDLTIELPDLFGDDADFLILPELLHSAVAQAIELKMHGYLRAPQITPVAFFQPNPSRRPLDPIPAPLQELPRKRF